MTTQLLIQLAAAAVSLIILYFVIRAAVAAGNRKSLARLEQIARISAVSAMHTHGLSRDELKQHLRVEHAAEVGENSDMHPNDRKALQERILGTATAS